MSRALALAAVVAAACTEGSLVDLGGDYRVAAVVPPADTRAIDLLFVVDASSSTEDSRGQVAAVAQQALFDVLAAAGAGMPDLHVGVITSNLGAGGYASAGCDGDGDGGRLQAQPSVDGCAAPDGNFLVDVEAPDGARQVNYGGTLAQAFGCLVQRPVAGCGFAQPLAATLRALSGEVPQNAGFLRPDAVLVVVVLTDVDDCSSLDPALYDPDDLGLGPPSSFRCFEAGVACDAADLASPGARQGCRARDDGPLLPASDVVDALRAVKADPGKVMVAVIAGLAGPVVVGRTEAGDPRLEASCTDPVVGGAAPALRLQAVLDAFPARGWFESLCEPSVAPALRRTAAVAADLATRRPCLRGTFRDLDPAAPGVQPSCRVAAVTKPFLDGEYRRELRACDGAAAGQACYRLLEDAAACGDGGPGLRVEVEGLAAELADTHLVVHCLAP